MTASEEEASLAAETASKCRTCGADSNVKRCSRCKSVWYCSRKCQRVDFAGHEQICRSVRELEDVEEEKSRSACENKIVGEAQSKVVSLIGGQCKVDCLLDGMQCDALWDTGGQLSIVG